MAYLRRFDAIRVFLKGVFGNKRVFLGGHPYRRIDSHATEFTTFNDGVAGIFSFGSSDAYVIVDMPDNVSVTAASLAVNSSGAVTAKVVVLMTPEEVDEACSQSPAYQAPGS